MSDKSYYYTGDVSLEYGGVFIDLSTWDNGYCDAVRVTDLDSGCGFRGACLIEHVTILGTDEPQRIRQALAGWGNINFRGLTKDAARMLIAEALLSYGHYDPAQPDHYFDDSPKAEIVQMEADGPMKFDGWKADKRLHGTELRPYVESVHLDGPVVPLPPKPVKPVRLKDDLQAFVDKAGKQLAAGDFLGIQTLADFLDDSGQHPEAAAFFRRVADEMFAGVCEAFGRSGWVSYNGDSGPDFLFRKLRGSYTEAIAVAWVELNEFGFLWSVDEDYNPSKEIDGWDQDHNLAWHCTAVAPPPDGYAVGYGIGGITFGGDGHPDGDPCKRDVERELAADLFKARNEFYYDPCGYEYLVIDREQEGPGIGEFDGRGTAHVGDPDSVGSTTISTAYLKACQEVEPWQVPPEWRKALIGV